VKEHLLIVIIVSHNCNKITFTPLCCLFTITVYMIPWDIFGLLSMVPILLLPPNILHVLGQWRILKYLAYIRLDVFTTNQC